MTMMMMMSLYVLQIDLFICRKCDDDSRHDIKTYDYEIFNKVYGDEHENVDDNDRNG